MGDRQEEEQEQAEWGRPVVGSWCEAAEKEAFVLGRGFCVVVVAEVPGPVVESVMAVSERPAEEDRMRRVRCRWKGWSARTQPGDCCEGDSG